MELSSERVVALIGVVAITLLLAGGVDTLAPQDEGAVLGVSNPPLAVSLDSKNPGYRLVLGGAKNVELLRLRFDTNYEDVDVRQLAFQDKTGLAGSTEYLEDRRVRLIDTDTEQAVGEAYFNGQYATSTVLSGLRVLTGKPKVLSVRANILPIHPNGPLTTSGNFLFIGYDASSTGIEGNRGVGVTTGNLYTVDGSDLSGGAIRIMRAIPIVNVATTSLVELRNGSVTLRRVSILADGGEIGLYKLTFRVGTSTQGAELTNFRLQQYADATFSAPVHSAIRASQVKNGIVELYLSSDSEKPHLIENGYTRALSFIADVSGLSDGSTVSIPVELLGDSELPIAFGTYLGTAEAIDADTHNNFIWTPRSSSGSTLLEKDFTNGYAVEGLIAP